MERKDPDRIACLVLAGPGDPGTPRWTSSIEESLSKGSEVHLYLIDRGVLHLEESDFFALNRDNIRLYACAYGTLRYGVPRKEPVVFAGLTVLHDLIAGCGRFVSAAPSREGEMSDWLLDRTLSIGRASDGRIEDLVVYIRWDPRESHLPVEGLRIASGMTVGDFSIRICLDPDAAPLLALPPDEVVDGDRRDDYIDILRRNGAIFHHEGAMPGDWEHEVESRPVSGEEARAIVSNAGRLIVV